MDDPKELARLAYEQTVAGQMQPTGASEPEPEPVPVPPKVEESFFGSFFSSLLGTKPAAPAEEAKLEHPPPTGHEGFTGYRATQEALVA